MGGYFYLIAVSSRGDLFRPQCCPIFFGYSSAGGTMCPTEKSVHRMLKKALQNHSDSEENIEEWVIHLLFGSNKLPYRTAEHSNSRVTLALSSCEMDVTPETQDIYNSELWNPVYTLTKTYSLYPKEHCAAASDVSYNEGRRQLPSSSPKPCFHSLC